MIDSPSTISKEQLVELGIDIKPSATK